MNILLLANHFNAGGISSYIITLARGLIARGHTVYVASRGGQWLTRLEHDGIEHIYVPLRTKSIMSPKLLFSYFILKKVIKEKGIQLLHSQTRLTNVLAYWLSKKTDVPFVSTAHGFYTARWERLIFPCWGKRVIAISDAVKEHLIIDFKVSREKVRLVHNGIDIVPRPSSLVPRPKEIRQSFGLKDGPVVGIIARLSEVKGHTYLITAMRKVIEHVPDAELLSIGDGTIKKELKDLGKSLALEAKLHFIPSVSDTTEALSVMDVFVMPSLQEGLGLAIMEAMAAGVPVAGSAVGGIASLIKDGHTGILVKPADSEALADAILELLKNREKAQAMASNAKALIEKEFSSEKMCEDTEKVYQEC